MANALGAVGCVLALSLAAACQHLPEDPATPEPANAVRAAQEAYPPASPEECVASYSANGVGTRLRLVPPPSAEPGAASIAYVCVQNHRQGFPPQLRLTAGGVVRLLTRGAVDLPTDGAAHIVRVRFKIVGHGEGLLVARVYAGSTAGAGPQNGGTSIAASSRHGVVAFCTAVQR